MNLSTRFAALLLMLVTLIMALPTLAESPPTTQTIVITVGGDCTVGCTVEQSKSKRGFRRYVEDNGFEWPFSGLSALFAEDDLTLVNLEGPLTEATKKVRKTHNFRAPKAYVEVLTHGSIEAVNLANNHYYDYGDIGYQETKQALDGAGIIHSGNGETAIYEVRGVKIGMTGYSYPFERGRKDVSSDVAALREAGCQIVIASFHWGDEYKYAHNDEQERIGRAAIDAGADVVIGHHPHVIQGIERYKDRLILYSLGNLMFGGNIDPKDRDAYVARLSFEVKEDGTWPPSIEIIPIRTTSLKKNTDYRPIIAPDEHKQRILDKIARDSVNFSVE